VNPFYKGKIIGRHVVVLDDCTTYGVSFGVAAAFLRKAGAAKVSCVALGKFGDQVRYYEIEIDDDPYGPISKGRYAISAKRQFVGRRNWTSQDELRSLIK
jgi:hypothetical protein